MKQKHGITTIIFSFIFILIGFYASGVKICGYVYDEQTNSKLANVAVTYLKQGTQLKQGTYTDSSGYFCITFKEQYIWIDASSIGYKPKNYFFHEIKNDTTINIPLQKEVKELKEVTVLGNNKAKEKVLTPQMGMVMLDKSTISNVPTMFGEHDIIKALQAQPGVSAGTEGFSGMYVRGGNNDENLFMMDGITLYQVTHLGGLFSTFNNEIIKDAEFYKSSFPARYGGRLSSVVNVSTQEGDTSKYSGSAMIGLISGKLNIGGPIVKGKTSFNAAIRRSWLDIISTPALYIKNKKDKKNGNKSDGRYAFTDINMRIDQYFNKRSKAYINFYFGQDYLNIGSTDFPPAYSNLVYEDKDIDKMKWGNMLASTGWKYDFSNSLKMQTSLYYTRYKSRLKRIMSESSGTKGEAGYKYDYEERTTENSIEDCGYKINFDYTPSQSHKINFGGEYIHHKYQPGYDNIKTNADITASDSSSTKNQIHANEASIYLEDKWNISEIISTQAGLRLGYYHAYNKSYTSLEPRISARVLLNRNLSLKSSYSRMTQYAQQISDSYIDLPTDFWLPITSNEKPLKSDQISTGLFYNLNNKYSISLEGYYKWMNNLIEYKDGYGLLSSNANWDDKLTTGKGWSYGLEFVASKEFGPLTGSVAYGLMWSNRLFAEVNNGLRYPAKYDNRHKINLSANYKLSENIELNGSWTYITGNRLTLALENYKQIGVIGAPSELAPGKIIDAKFVGYYESKNNIRLPAYHRLDLGINIYHLQKNGETGILTIGIYNAYCRMNPIVVRRKVLYTNEGDRKHSSFQTLSIFPIIPSISYTYKF